MSHPGPHVDDPEAARRSAATVLDPEAGAFEVQQWLQRGGALSAGVVEPDRNTFAGSSASHQQNDEHNRIGTRPEDLGKLR